MEWGNVLHETCDDMYRLTGKRDWTRDDVRVALDRAYRRYNTPTQADSPEGQARIDDDTDLFMETMQLPYYALSAAAE